MVCIYCGHSLTVANTRTQHHANQVWRRRLCSHCRALFTTHEVLDLSTALMVTYTDDKLLPFLREKLLISIYKSCGHKNTALSDARALTTTVIQRALLKVSSGSISSRSLALTCHSVLKDFDAAAAVQYEAYHANSLA